ncbi:MAG: aldehyde dehydrogenase family protein [Bacillota bacterium]
MSSEHFTGLIAGEWTIGRARDSFVVRNPADTAEIVGRFPRMTEEDLEAALDAAERALAEWRRTNIMKRCQVFRRTATLIRERAGEIARDITREMGKTVRESTGEVARAADFFDYYASYERWPLSYNLADAREGAYVSVVREPIGVVVAVTPWNDPFLTPARKLAPALVTGNTVILKPSSLSPLSGWHLVRCLHDAGLPKGVVNLVTGPGSLVSKVAAVHSAVKGITFTGSTEVGMQLQRDAAPRGIRVQTEMGGKNAAVILRDANLDLALEAVVQGAFGQAGQRCTATSRVIVESPVFDEFLSRLKRRVNAITVGPGLDASVDMGPVVDETQLKTVMEAIDTAAKDGARLLTGGHRLTEAPYARGYFVEPTVFYGVHPEIRLAQEEVFGPVLAVMEAHSVEEAIELVNRTRYGLSAAVFTRDMEHAYRFASEVEIGCVGVNLPTNGWDAHVPFGGFRESGSPYKEQGFEALHFYTRVKSVAIRAAGI